jgi:predicted O-methyltransferase YrrM
MMIRYAASLPQAGSGIMGWAFWIWAGAITAAALYAGTRASARLRELEEKIQRIADQTRDSVNRHTSAALSEQTQEIQNALVLETLGFRYPVHYGLWRIDSHLGRFLSEYLMETPPTTILELGAGTSSLLIARCGELLGTRWEHIAVDHEHRYLEFTRRLAQLNGLNNSIDFWECPLGAVDAMQSHWYTGLTERLAGRKIDLLVVDGPPNREQTGARYPALPLLYEHLHEHCTILVDDANRPDEQVTVARWMRQYPELSLSRHTEGHGLAVLRR